MMRAAVLADDGLYFRGRDVQPIDTKQIQNIVDLLTLAERFNCVQVWILPGSDLFKRLARHHKKLFKVADAQGWNYVPRELKNMVSGWRDNSRHQILFPGTFEVADGARRLLVNQWALEKITDARDLLAAIHWLIKTTGVYPSIPTRTARKIVEESIKKSRKPLKPCESDLSVFSYYKAPDIDYLRAPSADEVSRLHVHGFDKNYMFLSACPIHLGDGNFETLTGGGFDKTLPGIWKATISGGRADVLALCQLRGCEDEEEAGKFWFYTPTLALAEEYGATVEVEAAHVWRETRIVLNGFYKIVRAGVLQRETLKGPEQIAAKSLKDAYTHFIGWLARNSGESGQPFYRPDWRSLIVDTAYQREIRNIIKVADETGMMPFGIHRDCLLYLSDEPEAARAFPSPLTGEGAIYKHVFTASGGDLMKLLKGDVSISKVAGELKRQWKGARHGSKRRREAA